MGRGRGKGRKLAVARSHEDLANGAEETLPAYKRRGRPTKPLKDDINEDDIQKIEDDEDDIKLAVPDKDMEVSIDIENTKKRARYAAKPNIDALIVENSSVIEETTRTNGLRPNVSRRKGTPHRAAEVGVDCKGRPCDLVGRTITCLWTILVWILGISLWKSTSDVHMGDTCRRVCRRTCGTTAHPPQVDWVL